jgi:hypothetical protein
MWASYSSDTYLYDSHHPIPLLPPPGETPYAFKLLWTKTLTVFPSLKGGAGWGWGDTLRLPINLSHTLRQQLRINGEAIF